MGILFSFKKSMLHSWTISLSFSLSLSSLYPLFSPSSFLSFSLITNTASKCKHLFSCTFNLCRGIVVLSQNASVIGKFIRGKSVSGASNDLMYLQFRHIKTVYQIEKEFVSYCFSSPICRKLFTRPSYLRADLFSAPFGRFPVVSSRRKHVRAWWPFKHSSIY